jgi:hypothetical protein
VNAPGDRQSPNQHPALKPYLRLTRNVMDLRDKKLAQKIGAISIIGE